MTKRTRTTPPNATPAHTINSKLRRVRHRPWSANVWTEDRVLLIAQDDIMARRVRLVMVIKRRASLVLCVSWFDGEGGRFSVRLQGSYTVAAAEQLIGRVRHAFSVRTPPSVFVDLQPDGDVPGTALRIAGHLRDRGCELCGLPSRVEKRRHGQIPYPFEMGAAPCDQWRRFLIAASPPSGIRNPAVAAYRSRS